MSDNKYDIDTVRKAWGAGRHSRQSSYSVWVVASPGDSCFAGKQTKRTTTHVEIELLDAVMLAFGLASLTGELRQFACNDCRFFNDAHAMADAVHRACYQRDQA